MDSQALHSNDKDVHFLFEPLRDVIALSTERNENGEQLVDRILRLLDKKRLVTYAAPHQIQLLNSHGRVLIAILEDPGITQRALSQYVGVSESNVNATIKLLLKNDLITKTRVKNRNQYFFNYEKALDHPDISRFLNTLLPYVQSAIEAQRPQSG